MFAEKPAGKMVLATVILLAAAFTAVSQHDAADGHNKNAILLKNSRFDTAGHLPEEAGVPLQHREDPEDHYIVQFTGHIKDEWKQALRNSGAVLFDYVPNNALIVRMNSSVMVQVKSLDFVQWVGIYHSAYRTDHALSDSIVYATNSGKSVHENITVLLFDAKDSERVSAGINSLGGEIVKKTENRIQIRIDAARVPDIAAMNGVSWIEKYVRPEILNDITANITNVCEVRNTYGLTGRGQVVAVADSGLDTGTDDHGISGDIHADLDNRVTFFNYWGSGPDDNNGHGTHTAGTVAGNGSRSGGQYKGIAPEADVIFQALGDDAGSGYIYITNLTEVFQDAYESGARVHSNSWGSDSGGTYTALSQKTDQFAWDNKDIVIVFAAGNSGSSGINSPATAKNVITVGASENLRPLAGPLADNINEVPIFSSRGPTDDGRIKPDVVAPGTYIISTRSSRPEASYSWGTVDSYYAYDSGTSMATPAAAGTAVLIRQYYIENESVFPSAALIKATLINGAADMGLPSGEQGFGRVDIRSSLFPGSPRTVRYYDNVSLNTSQWWNMSYHIDGGTEPLRVTLVWTDFPAAPFAAVTLVNNLDLIVTGPDGTYYGNGAEDSINNVERVDLASPATGCYIIHVKGTNVPQGPQPFALVVSGALTSQPRITSATANPAAIEANGTHKTVLNVTASDRYGIASVSLDLSSIGGAAEQVLTNNSGVWQYFASTTALGTFHLPVNVTNNEGISNSSTALTLTTVDTEPPVSNSPGDTEISENTTWNFTEWTLTDLHPGYYLVLRNGTQIVPPTPWENNTNLTVPVNTSPGYYNYTIQYNDTAGNSGTPDTVIVRVVDTSPPVISGRKPSNGTPALTPVISVNATDSGSGVNASSAEMIVNGTKVIPAINSSGYTFNFVGTTPAAYDHGDTVNVTFSVSDNEGHRSNTSWMFYIDNVDPVINIISHDDGYSTSAASVTIRGTVNGTGSPPEVRVNGIPAASALTAFNGTFSAAVPVSKGPNTIYVNAVDAAGNTNTTSIVIIRTVPVTSGSGGGGGGGGGASAELYENILVKEKHDLYIFKDKVTSYRFVHPGNPLMFVNITGNINAGEINAATEVLKNTSLLVNDLPPGTVYRNINIWVGTSGFAVPRNIREAVIRFRVENAWLESMGLGADDVVLHHWYENRWDSLETNPVGKDENYTFFEAKTVSFSSFAISAIKNGPQAKLEAELPEPLITVVDEALPVSTPGEKISSPGFETVPGLAVLILLCSILRRRR